MMAQTIQGVKLVLADSSVFTDAIDAISKLVDETTITVTPTHLEIIAMDPANVAMVVLKMNATEFMGYSVAEDTKFAIKLPNLKQVLSRCKGKDNTLSLAVENNQLLIVSSGKSRKQFTLPLLELEEKQQKMPELKWTVEVSIDNTELKDAIADVSIASESCEFKVSDNQFIVSGSGDTGKVVSETKGKVRELGDTKTAKSKYAIEYVDKMVGTKLSKTSKIFLGKDYPMKLSFVNDKGSTTIEYLLAPRIDND